MGIRGGWATPIIENRTEELLGIIATYYAEVRHPSDHENDVDQSAGDVRREADQPQNQ